MRPEETGGGFESLPDLTHHQFRALDGPVSMYEAGDPAKPAVVMLHGAMYDEARFIWDCLFPYLSGFYHVYALDFSGEVINNEVSAGFADLAAALAA